LVASSGRTQKTPPNLWHPFRMRTTRQRTGGLAPLRPPATFFYPSGIGAAKGNPVRIPSESCPWFLPCSPRNLTRLP
jgi:hypothetical protein